jgi:hypothetical protein
MTARTAADKYAGSQPGLLGTDVHPTQVHTILMPAALDKRVDQESR